MLCTVSSHPTSLHPQTNPKETTKKTKTAANADECVLSICAYDNEAGDAVVGLTMRGCIMQFIYLMRPTCLAIPICFQGERSNIGVTTQSEPSFNKSTPCPWLLAALFCFAHLKKKTKKKRKKKEKQVQSKPNMFFFFLKVEYIFEQCNVLKDNRHSFEMKQQRIKQRKKNTHRYNVGLCGIWIDVLKLKGSLQDSRHDDNELFETEEHEFVGGISCSDAEQRFQYLPGRDQCLMDSFSQQVTLVSVLFLFFFFFSTRSSGSNLGRG